MPRTPTARFASGRADWRRRFQTAALGAALSLARRFERLAGKPPARRRLISCLRGLAPADLAARLCGAAPEFGIFAGLPVGWVEERVDFLIEEGYLEESAARDGAAAGLALAAAGRRALGGGRIDPPAAPPPPAPEALQSAGPAGRLRRLRAALARERGRPAYGIFSNAVLLDIAARRPRHLGELAAVPGIGPARLRDFGRRIIEALNKERKEENEPQRRRGRRDGRRGGEAGNRRES